MNPKLESSLNIIERGEMQSACIHHLVNTYYQDVIHEAVELADDECCDLPFPEELLLPVEERKSGIGSAIADLVASGHDVDESDGYCNALMLAVMEGDAPMVHTLLAYGADARAWPNMDQEPDQNRGNFYLDHIDIHFMLEGFPVEPDSDYLKAYHRTAVILALEAHLSPYDGHCLKIDENGNISLKASQMLYTS